MDKLIICTDTHLFKFDQPLLVFFFAKFELSSTTRMVSKSKFDCLPSSIKKIEKVIFFSKIE